MVVDSNYICDWCGKSISATTIDLRLFLKHLESKARRGHVCSSCEVISCDSCKKTALGYSFWSLYAGAVCARCSAPMQTPRVLVSSQDAALALEAEAEAARRSDEARNALYAFAAALAPNQTFTLIGVGYWSTAGSTVSTVVSKLFVPVLMGGGPGSKVYRQGVIALSNREMFIIDCGELHKSSIGALLNLSVEEILKAQKTASMKVTPISDLAGESRENVLSLRGGGDSERVTHPKGGRRGFGLRDRIYDSLV